MLRAYKEYIVGNASGILGAAPAVAGTEVPEVA
jgi:hypothetical protein